MIDWVGRTRSLGFETERAMLAKLYESMSISEIGRLLRVSGPVVRLRLHALEIPLRPRGGANNIARVLATLHWLDQRLLEYSEGVTVTLLARKLRIGQYSLRRYRRMKHGLLHNIPRGRPREIRDTEQEALGPSSSSEPEV